MPNATWKEAERRAARALGGRRVGPTGRIGADVDAGWLLAEVKHRASLPLWLGQALEKIRAVAGPSRLGVVVAHEEGARDSWVILSLADWRAWFGDIKAPGDDAPEDGAGGDLPRAAGDQLGPVALTAEDLRAVTGDDFRPLTAEDLRALASDAPAGDPPRAEAARTRRRG